MDDYVITSNISNITDFSFDWLLGGVKVIPCCIVDLTGLEDFINLRNLVILDGNYTSFDLPQTLINLKTITFEGSSHIRNMSLNSQSLERINIINTDYGIGITDIPIDTSELPNLKYYSSIIQDLNGNIVSTFKSGWDPTSLDFSNNPEMIEISSSFGNLRDIDISGCNKLNSLLLRDNINLDGILDISHIRITADVRINGTGITCLQVNAEQLGRKDLLKQSNSGGPGGTVGKLDINSGTTVALDCNNPLSPFTYNFDVTATSNTSYKLGITNSSWTEVFNDPPLTINVSDTINFTVDASGHPFYIKTVQGTGTDNLASGVTNQGTVSGTLTFSPTTRGTYYYQCSSHNDMYGTITVN